jgi:hypothetical protein
MPIRRTFTARWLGSAMRLGVSRTARLAWFTWWLMVLATAASALPALQAVQRWRTERAQLAASPQAPRAAQVAPTADADPSQHLSGLPDSAAAVGFVESVAARLGVHVHRVQMVERAPTPAQLARLELQLVLHGGYGDIKALLGEVAAKYATSTVSRLALQPLDSRAGTAPSGSLAAAPVPGSAPLQAQVVWVLWGPPQPASMSAITALPAR